MLLGARWLVGDPPHRSVPQELRETISEQEAQHPDADAWTLTWLEGRPQCALDGLVLVELDATGASRVTVLHPWDSVSADSDDTADLDDWLSE
ncbi:Fe-S oxidoreductase [Leucobacter sp. W1478]|uniref:Fe-S oxidoreductase n=1 Tax=Leucobacter sp. W1478 TaxID=3439065 RepID=UPI003F40D581